MFLKKLNLKIYLIDPKILRYPEGYDLADIAKNVNILQYIRDNKELVSKQTFQKHKILCEIYNLQNLDEQELANIYQKVNEQIITKWTQYFELLYALLLKEKVTIFRKYDYTFISLSALKVEYQNWPCYLYSGRITAKGKIEITRKKKNPVELWLESPDRKEYYSIGFRDNHKMLGLFHGWPYRPKQGKCDNFINFIHEIIRSGNDQYTEWLLDWIAHIVQRPEHKDEVSTSIVLRGSKRLGKSFFSRKLMDLIGFDPMNPNKSFALKINSNLQLTGRFNFHLAWKLLVIAEELKWDGRGEGVLKDIIDTPFLTVEPKGRDIYAMPNLMRLIILSNENWIVPATMDESRFFVLDVSEKRKEDIPYFNLLNQHWIDGEREAFLHFLIQRKIQANLRSAPRTKAFFEQVWNSLKAHELWLLESLWDGRFEYETRNPEGKICKSRILWPDNAVLKIGVAEFYDSYMLFIKERNRRDEIIPKNKLKTILERSLKIKIDMKRTGRQRYYVLPSAIRAKTILADLFPEDQAPF